MAAFDSGSLEKYDIRVLTPKIRKASIVMSENFPPATPDTLAVASVPNGASFYLNGSLLGTTPLTTTSFTVGSNYYTASLDGFFSYSSTFTAVNGTNYLTVDFQQLTSSVSTHADRPSIL